MIQSSLVGRTVQFARPAGATSVPATTSLFSAPGVLEGVLFRDITTIEQAMDCGGLVMQSGNRWVFYCGDTLKLAYAAGILGQVSRYDGVITSLVKTNMYGAKAYAQWEDANSVVLDRHILGTKAWSMGRSVSLSPYFGAGLPLTLYGIVTPATRGHGISHNVSQAYENGVRANWSSGPAFSFMTTDTPMNGTLANFLANARSNYLNSVASEARTIMGAAYDAERVKETSHPALCATTAWTGSSLTSVPIPNPGLIHSQDSSDFVFQAGKADLNDVAGWNHNEMNVETLVSPTISRPVTRWNWRQGQTRADALYNSENLSIYFVVACETVLGKAPASHPFLPNVSPSQACGYRGVASINGTVEGYDAGGLRDGHTLYRKLVQEQTFRTPVSNYASIAAYVQAGMPLLSESQKFFLNEAATVTGTVEAQNAAASGLLTGPNAVGPVVGVSFGFSELVPRLNTFLERTFQTARAMA